MLYAGAADIAIFEANGTGPDGQVMSRIFVPTHLTDPVEHLKAAEWTFLIPGLSGGEILVFSASYPRDATCELVQGLFTTATADILSLNELWS